MNKTENNYEYLETSPEALSRGLRRITRPKFLDNLPEQTGDPKGVKSRITILLDADIVDFFKNSAAEKGAPAYQTQINSALRKVVEALQSPSSEVVTTKMLDNPAFLSELARKLKQIELLERVT